MNSSENKNRPPYKLLVTAGPTVEPLDPIRFISNYSTGEMGYKIAAEGVRRGFQVCLVSGPVNIDPPSGVEVVKIKTAKEMRDEVMEKVDGIDCIVMAAAVCDFRPEREEKNKIKKQKELTLKLEKNPDILLEVGEREGLVKIGFALETEDPEKYGEEKLKNKDLDLIIINEKNREEDPFGKGKKKYIILDKAGNKRDFNDIDKENMAVIIIDEAEKLISEK